MKFIFFMLFYFVSFYFFVVLGVEPGTLPVLGRRCSTGPSPHSVSKHSGLCWLGFSFGKSNSYSGCSLELHHEGEASQTDAR